VTPWSHSVAELDRTECLHRLAPAGVARVAATVAALPTIFPADYALLDDDIVFRAVAGATLRTAVRGTVIALQVDDIEPGAASGWSIVVVGHAHELTSPDEIASAHRLLLYRGQARGTAESFFCLSTEVLSGRSFDTTPGATG
jgi:nitroimidazol reductase NimA-like FMN-containing flavoprotein (pyridoxamine 5'-phosphate oxidase superfamily)